MRLSQLAPLPVRQAVWKSVEFSLIPPARHVPRPKDGPIIIAGMFSCANGLGQSARYAYDALKSCGIDVHAFDTAPILGQADFEWNGKAIASLPKTREGLLIIYNNAPEVGRILLYAGRRNRREWCTASMWHWETPQRPDGWIERAAVLDELWFPSRFVRDALAPSAPTRSLVAFHPITPEKLPKPANDIAPAGTVVFTCYGDARSSLYRKNPIGAVKAFRKAFGDSKAVRLIVKTRNSSKVANQNALAAAIGDSQNIVMIDNAMPGEELAALKARTDVLVSLHRSEGFGLPIAEAMLNGTPVIATNWSAPAEYLSEKSSYLVPAREIPLEDESGVYRDVGHTWGDPDLNAAAAAMQQAVEDPAGASSRAEQARKDALRLFSAEAYRQAIGL